MKKAALLIGLVACMLLSAANFVFANEEVDTLCDNGSGIVFSHSDEVQITYEKMGIKFDGGNANIESVYYMKNTTQSAIRVEALLLSTSDTTERREVNILANDTKLDVTRNLFGYNQNINREEISFDAWNNIIQAAAATVLPFGDGKGFTEYTFKKDGDFNMTFGFTKSFFCPQNVGYTFNGTDFIISGKDQVVLVSKQDLKTAITSNFDGIAVAKQPVNDIYDYLYEYGTENGTVADAGFIDQAFQSYLSNFASFSEDIGVDMIDMFDFSQYEGKYLEAIGCSFDILGEQTIAINVQRGYKLGHTSVGNKNLASFSYVMTPAKYFSDNSYVEISVESNNKYPYLVDSNLKFKEQNGSYVFASEGMASETLNISYSNFPRGALNPVQTNILISLILPALSLAAALVLLGTRTKNKLLTFKLSTLFASIAIAITAVGVVVILAIDLLLYSSLSTYFAVFIIGGVVMIPLLVALVFMLKNYLYKKRVS